MRGNGFARVCVVWENSVILITPSEPAPAEHTLFWREKTNMAAHGSCPEFSCTENSDIAIPE